MGVYGKGSVGKAEKAVEPQQAIAEGQGVQRLPIAWACVTDAMEEAIEVVGWRVEGGEKHLRYGTIMVEITTGESQGKFAPFDPQADDGREKLEVGKVFILDATVREYDQTAKNGVMFDTGVVYKERLLVGSSGQPSWLDLEAALPELRLIASE